MALQLYTNAIVYFEGAQLTQETDVSVDRTTGSQPVTTVGRGYGGESPGAPMTEVSVSSAAPSASFEFDPGSFMKTLKFGEMSIFASGKTLTFKCFIYTDNFSHAVNTESKLSFKARGPYADWK